MDAHLFPTSLRDEIENVGNVGFEELQVSVLCTLQGGSPELVDIYQTWRRRRCYLWPLSGLLGGPPDEQQAREGDGRGHRRG